MCDVSEIVTQNIQNLPFLQVLVLQCLALRALSFQTAGIRPSVHARLRQAVICGHIPLPLLVEIINLLPFLLIGLWLAKLLELRHSSCDWVHPGQEKVIRTTESLSHRGMILTYNGFILRMISLASFFSISFSFLSSSYCIISFNSPLCVARPLFRLFLMWSLSSRSGIDFRLLSKFRRYLTTCSNYLSCLSCEVGKLFTSSLKAWAYQCTNA